MLVCLCVCLSVCPVLLVKKIPAKRMNRFGRDFHKMVAYYPGSNFIEIGDLGSKVKVTVTQYPFFFIIFKREITINNTETNMFGSSISVISGNLVLNSTFHDSIKCHSMF